MACKRQRGKTFHWTVRRKKLLPAPIYPSFDDEDAGDRCIERLESLLDQGILPPGFQSRPVRLSTIGETVRGQQRWIGSFDAKS